MDLSKYNYPRGRFKVYFDSLREQIYKHSETGRVSCDFFEEFKRQINNLNIPEKWKSEYCFENINSRLERIFEKKTDYKDISEVPVHEIFEYAQVLLSNYYEQEENKSYEEIKKILKEVENRVYRSINLRALDEKLGIGNYFVQRVEDKVELIYNLGDGYVATLPLQKQKIEDVLNAEDILNQKVTLDVKDSGFGKIVPKTSDNGLDVRTGLAKQEFLSSIRGEGDANLRSDDFVYGFKKGFAEGRNSFIPELSFKPIPDFVYYTPKTMNLDVNKVLQRAREEYKKSLDKNILNEEEFVRVIEKILTDEDKTELACALVQ